MASFVKGVLNWSSRNHDIDDPEDSGLVIHEQNSTGQREQPDEFSTVSLGESISADDPPGSTAKVREVVDIRKRPVSLHEKCPGCLERISPLLCQIIVWAWLAGSAKDADWIQNNGVGFAVRGLTYIIFLLCILILIPFFCVMPMHVIAWYNNCHPAFGAYRCHTCADFGLSSGDYSRHTGRALCYISRYDRHLSHVKLCSTPLIGACGPPWLVLYHEDDGKIVIHRACDDERF